MNNYKEHSSTELKEKNQSTEPRQIIFLLKKTRGKKVLIVLKS